MHRFYQLVILLLKLFVLLSKCIFPNVSSSLKSGLVYVRTLVCANYGCELAVLIITGSVAECDALLGMTHAHVCSVVKVIVTALGKRNFKVTRLNADHFSLPLFYALVQR